MKRTTSFLKAAILGTLVLVASQSFAFDFTNLVVRTASDAVFSQGCSRRSNLDSECQSNFDRGLVANS